TESGDLWSSDEAGSLLQQLHPDDRPTFQAAVARALACPGEVLRVQARALGADGSVRWLEARGQAWRDEDGRLRGVRGSLADVSELKKVEEDLRRNLVEQREALLESGELYRAYFTASPVALFVSDTRGQYLEANGAACALTGYARDELVGLSIADLLGGDDGALVAERLVGLLALGAGRSEVRIRRKDGSVRHCLVHATPIGDDRVLGFLLDVTESREAEEKLLESEDRFRTLSEAAFEAILVHDGGRIVDVNQALCELGGYSWHELVGRDAFELIAPEHREMAYRNLLAEHERPYEIEAIRRDGTRLPVEVQGRSFPYRGEVHRVVAIRDISERKKAERVRESLIRELEAKNAELERFGYTVTHDLKAPLVTIQGFADYVERDAREGRTDRLAADAGRIRDAVAKLQQLLDELFELSRAGRPVGPPAAVPAAELVQEALRLVHGRHPEGGVRVEVAGPLPVVFGDRARLVQVLQNLLDNAMKFAASAAEPLVTVEARAPVEGKAVLVVRDNGIGIEPRHRDRVFGVFEKLDPRAQGHGVGLALVKRVVESHGGRVWLESEGRGTGTAACVTLPLAGSANGMRETTTAAGLRQE
ncbi:MAG TPA: PAS domain S-box protein, partial [Vicinamibacteria bacterium]|nr:PAS domain S-box protein [Vicinamibacteria bacterium]